MKKVLISIGYLVWIFFPLESNALSPWDKLYLDKDQSIVLPYFDTRSIQGQEISSMFLKLYLLETNAQGRTIQLTINPYNSDTGEARAGLSIFISPQINQYTRIELPKELFTDFLHSNEVFLIRLVDEDARLVFASAEIRGSTKDPILEIAHSNPSEKSTQASPTQLPACTQRFHMKCSLSRHTRNSHRSLWPLPAVDEGPSIRLQLVKQSRS